MASNGRPHPPPSASTPATGAVRAALPLSGTPGPVTLAALHAGSDRGTPAQCWRAALAEYSRQLAALGALERRTLALAVMLPAADALGFVADIARYADQARAQLLADLGDTTQPSEVSNDRPG